MGIVYRRGVVVSLLAALLSLFPAATLAARQPLIAPLDRSKVAAPRFDIKSVATPIAIDRKRIAAIARNDEMDLPLPDGKSFVVTFDRVEDHGGGIVSRVGYLRDHGNNFRVILTSGPSGTFGSIITPDTHYRVVPGDGADWLVDMTEENVHVPFINLGKDYRRAPVSPEKTKDKHEANQAQAQKIAEGEPAPAIDLQTPAPVDVDIMIVYSAGLATRLGSGLMTRLYNLVTAANTAYADSQVGINLRLVHAMQTSYTDATDNGTALDAITPNNGVDPAFSTVETTRTAVGADIVALLRTGSDFGGSGLAWLTTTDATVAPSATFMYSVTTGCVVGCDSVFIHEVGHNMGNAHDRATVRYQSGSTTIGPQDEGAYPYSFGHYVCFNGLTCDPAVTICGTQPVCAGSLAARANDIGTIMSYFNPVTLKFSNPNVMCRNPSTGTVDLACGVAGQADNALSMNNMRFRMRDVKATQVTTPTGALQFSAANFTANESSGIATVTVSRVGGSGGSVSVNYATSDGAAKAGFDYVATNGTLTWAAGDTSNKSFTVTLINDGVTEGAESFSVVLSNPSGATGVTLGLPTTASVQINEGAAWPPGGLFPTGFVTPGASSGAWTTATDFASEGTVSLRSARVIGDGANFTNSDVTFTGMFVNGTVSFDYRVSSYGDVSGITQYGFFEFLIDGVSQFSDAGETVTFLPLSFPITAGTHTLTWRYKNKLNNFCNAGFNPPPPGGPNCADRAWIDALSMPLAVVSSATAIATSGTPSAVGQAVTFTATVTGTAGTPAGVVNFKDNGAVIAGCSLVATSGGVATCTTSSLSVGAHSITAEYSGNATYDISISAPLTQTVSGVLLTVSKSGTGSGTVAGTGINCGVDCTEGFAPGTMVTLTATPAGGSIFAGWSGGGCAGTGSCTVTVNSATTVTASFTALVTLTVTSSGTGTGTVTGTGINCGIDCSEAFIPSTMVTLTATPSGSSSFTGWSGGGCAGTGTCTVTVNAATTVTATFTLLPVTLTTAKAGNGAGTISGTGINCGVDCTESVAPGTVVALTASPSAGSTFTGWSGGGCTGTGVCNVTVNAATTVTATFTLQQFVLTSAKSGTGAGTITGTGFNCGVDCTETVNFGTVVVLTATPAGGSSFAGWSGGGCTGTGTCSVTVNAATTVTATFTLLPVTLTVSPSGNGAGTVTGTGIACGVDCTESVAPGTMITLTASPSAGSTFAGWSGGGCAGTGTCNVSVNAATTVTATFTLQQFTISVTKSGAGVGTVTSAPGSISCGATCAGIFDFGTSVTLTATAGLNSVFAGWSGGGCTGTAPCTFPVSAAATVTAAFSIAANPPDAPTGVAASAGSGLAVISFTPPGNNGGSPVTGYTATCAGTGGTAVFGPSSPIIVSPLTNGNLYSCSVKATNINGDSVASASVPVTPSAAAPIALLGVTSRKNHGTAGDQDLPVLFATPLAGAITVEPRTSSGSHQLRFQFNVPVNSAGTASVVTTGNVVIGSASAVADGSNIVTVTLTGVPDNSRALVSVNSVNGTYLAQSTIGFLVGDVNGLGSVSASDLSAIKSRLSQPAISASRFDLNRSGTVDGNDVSVAKSASGRRLPP